MLRRYVALAAAAVCLTLSFAASATAHYRTERQWYFGGSTYEDNDGRPGGRVDPINMLIYPYGGERPSFEDHFEHHWRPQWFSHEELGRPYCRGDQLVGIKNGSSYRYLPTDFHGAGGNRCLTRYHIRVWGDGEHEIWTGTQHTDQSAWQVAGIHYERINPPFGGDPGVGGHSPRRDWDLVEFYAIHQRSKMAAHRGDYKWKPLPFSKGDYQGFDSDGFISRINGRRHDSD